MTVANMARRLFFARAAGAAAAAPMLAKALTDAQPEPHGGNVMCGAPTPMPMTPARLALHAFERKSGDERWRRLIMRPRVGMIDYDIAGHRSWSAAFRLHAQAEREVARRQWEIEQSSIWDRLHAAVYGQEV